MFGRLAPGRTADDAQAELTVIGQQTAAAFPRTHELEREIGIRAALGADPLRIVRSIFAQALPSLNVQAPLSLNARTPE